jgi:hypothetical protein
MANIFLNNKARNKQRQQGDNRKNRAWHQNSLQICPENQVFDNQIIV